MASTPPNRPPPSHPPSPGPPARISTERVVDLLERILSTVDNMNRSFNLHREENVERWVALNQRLDTSDAQVEGIARCLLSQFGHPPPPPPPPPPPTGVRSPVLDDDDEFFSSSSEN